MIALRRVWVVLITTAGTTGCMALATGQLRKDHAAWIQYQTQITGTSTERMQSCAAKPFATETAGDSIVTKYGLRKDFPGEALVYCVLTTHSQNGRVTKYFTQSGNPGGNTKGDQLCALLVDRCYGDGNLIANAGNSEGLISVFASERDVREAAMWTRKNPTQPSQAMQMLTLMSSAASASDAAQGNARTVDVQQLLSLQQQAGASSQQSTNEQLMAAQRQIDQLRLQLQQQQQPLGAGASNPAAAGVVAPSPAATYAPIATPRASPAPAPALNASFKHSSRYESNGSGGLVYVVAVLNDGGAVLKCDVQVSALVWNAGGGPQNLQSNYSDRRQVVVYPGREGTAGFGRVVANTGKYELSCERE